jgi:hypothetical protein
MATGWTLRTGDGNIVLRLADSFAANLSAHTADGHVTIDFPVTMEGSLRENDVRGKINGGGPILELRSGDGNIELEKI